MGASNFVEGVDLAFKVIFGISIFFLVGITAVMLYFLYRYNRKRHPKAIQIKESPWLEFTWIFVPFILVLLMFYYGYVAFSPMRNVPEDAIPIKVIGRMWSWTFEYPNKKQAPILVVPINQAVRLNLYSDDVLHALYIPAFRVKEDVVPGKDNYLWFMATQFGEYDVLCTVFCGVRHSYMETKARVVTMEEYEKWLKELPDPTLEHPGLTVLKKNACTGCHSIDGSKLISNSFKKLWNSRAKVITDGKERTVTVDEEYIKRSIYEPDADQVVGFPKGMMKSYKGLITEEEVNQVVEYLKTLK